MKVARIDAVSAITPVGVEIRDLKKCFRLGSQVTNAVDGLSMTANKEEVVCILGPSGCGKSTVLN
ncbi:MAG: ATP-binding cassette domain-containing protein, partial [Thermoanaerobaculia bacterium]